jgi:capsular exopolysaccharide synthesis family protein
MSEIFKFLNKVEPNDSASRLIHTPASEFQEEAQEEAAPQPQEVRHSDVPVQPLQFGVESIDQRLKAALNAQSFPGEQFRFLRTRLNQLQQQKNLKTLLLTSSLPGEGKTFISCSIASILAQEPEKRVLLIDADLRLPQTGKALGIAKNENLPGLADLLSRTHRLREVILQSSAGNLSYIPAGVIPQNPSELLASNSLDKNIAEAAETFDWIIIDSPPVLSFADPIRLAAVCDSILFVVGANKTPAKMIQKSIQMLGKNRICGVVLNRTKNSSSSNYYYRYYSGTGKKIK